jgi:hypothetical protein
MGGMHGSPRKRLVRRPASAFDYAQVEAALATAFNSKEVQKAAFRGRMKHLLHRLNLLRKSPGKSRRVWYTRDDVAQLLICLELSEAGIDPHLIVDIVRRDWARRGPLWETTELTQFQGDDWFVPIRINFMTWQWQPKTSVMTESAEGISVTSGRHRSPVRVLTPFRASEAAIFWEQNPEGGLFVFNLSARLRALNQALATDD